MYNFVVMNSVNLILHADVFEHEIVLITSSWKEVHKYDAVVFSKADVGQISCGDVLVLKETDGQNIVEDRIRNILAKYLIEPKVPYQIRYAFA